MLEASQAELYTRLPENAVRILSRDEPPPETSQPFWRPPKLFCRFEIAVLEFPLIPDYDALSYVWGDATEQIPILCNGVYMTIGKNLFSALSQIWALEPEQRMWADAICINQADLDEKSTQVAMMARIYASALKVRIWLGPEVRLTRLLREKIKSCGSIDQLKAEVNQDLTLQMVFFHLGSRSWFYRIWTLQEVRLASKAIVQCGLLRLDWTIFKELSRRLQFAKDVVRSTPASPVKQNSQNENPGFSAVFNLQRELQETYDRGATDLRDKVYALLGLPSLKLFRQIRPNYSLPLVDAFTSVTKEFIAIAQNLSIFLIAGIANRKEALREAVSDPRRSFDNLYPEHPVWKTPSSGLGSRLVTPSTTEMDIKWLLEWEAVAASLPSWVPNFNAPLDPSNLTETWRRSLEGAIRPSSASGRLLGPGSRDGKIELRGRALGVLRTVSHQIEAFPDCARDRIPAAIQGALVDMSQLCQALKDHEEHRCGCSNQKPRFMDLQLSGEFYVQMNMAWEPEDWICALDGFSELCLLRLASQLSMTRRGLEHVRTPEFELVSPLVMASLDSIRELPRNLPGFEVSFVIR